MKPTVKTGIVFLSKSMVIVAMLALSFACRNEMKDIRAFDTPLDSLPGVSAYDIEFIYSDSARIQVRLLAPTMHNYEGEDPYMEFPDGFEVIFYDSVMNVKSRITANYGINYRERRLMEAHSDVVVNNYETDEQLNTEELIWDQRKELIYSNKFVKITTADGVLYGDGLESDQTFSNRRIMNVSGEMMVDEENR